MPSRTLVFHNNVPVFGWAFMAIWTAMLALFTGLFVREGGFHQFHPLVDVGIMALFWLFGLAGCYFFFAMPHIRLTIDGGKATVHERWAWRSRMETFSLKAMSEPVFVEDKDSEGDPYFRSSIVTPSGRTIVFSEHNHKPVVEAARDRMIAALS